MATFLVDVEPAKMLERTSVFFISSVNIATQEITYCRKINDATTGKRERKREKYIAFLFHLGTS